MPRFAEFLPRASALLLALATASSFAQSSCPVQPKVPSTLARKALDEGDHDRALELARKAASASEAADTFEDVFATAHAEYARMLLSIARSREAISAANDALARYPNNALLLDVLGEIRFRRGELAEAFDALSASLKADPCSGRTHYDVARYNHLNTQFLNESKQLDVAHALAPHDKAITEAYQRVHREPPSLQHVIDTLKKKLADPTLSAEKRVTSENTLRTLESYRQGSCRIATPQQQATIPMTPISGAINASVPLSFNGRHAILELDSGASGITISQEVAHAAGLTVEGETASYGIGDEEDLHESLAHVDSLRVGTLEFHNCLVHIMKENRLHSDGLLGPDIFSSWVVTIDVPQRQIRLSPLPPRPGDAPDGAELATFVTTAPILRNRYTPPEFQDWTPVFRDGHALLVPTSINGGPQRLFLLDTGAGDEGLISISAAREATDLGDGHMTIHGVSGVVQDVRDALDVTLTFSHVRQRLIHVPAINLDRQGRPGGPEISGLIGFLTLRNLVLSIDYRDSLLKIVYPKHK